ncbi:sulfotransferase [Microbulbifer hydrolyticus]|uniref:Sulfotransferase n=1 Tax=Microbulbifer hydrolyticus TaxID=48074 RepID=A0A6P1TB16_9GAMM|nr:sulfotransferase [Microbulbifer hydrolyticus]MBB5210599.1 hypothetical protein [Microbulbifer hydrolyticus]QHQ38935.1 hypothetical protein GTQ55_08035 [Microbulbifer hydrolyticus]
MPVSKLFLSVGAMKAGTTFLYNVFQKHPDLYFTPEKELHYFAHTNGLSRKLQKPLSPTLFNTISSNLTRKHTILSTDFRRHRLSMVMHNRYAKLKDPEELRDIVRWYSDKYLTSPVNDAWFESVFADVGDRYACDFSNYHALLSPRGWDHVKRLAPKLRVIYVLRHPVARLWSHIKFDLIHSGRKHELENFSLKDLEAKLTETGISSHSRYGDIAQQLKGNLSSNELKIIPFESFIENFESSVREIEEFLEIKQHTYTHVNTHKKSNPSIDLTLPPALYERLREAVRPELKKLEQLGIQIPESYKA